MSAHCHHHHDSAPTTLQDPSRYRRILWIALLSNALMLFVELGAGYRAGSVSLLADAIDFAGDAINYGISLAVLGSALAWRARAALLKASAMLVFGVLVLGRAAWSFYQGVVPDAPTMGAIGTLALAVNLGVAWLLYAFREGDANMRSVWLCTRNDALGNIAVLCAALGVFGTGSGWPDLMVASTMAGLALHSGQAVLRQALQELRHG